MLVLWEQRLVVLATPKTGSTALAAALEPLAALSVARPPVLKHTPAYRFRRFLGPYLEASAGGPFTVVAMMREPRDWLGSWFRFRRRDDIANPANSTAGMDFERFVEGYMRTPRPPFADVGSQARFVSHEGGLGVDRLFRYDDFGGFTAFLEDQLGFALELPRVNVSPPGEIALTSETEARLRAHAAEDFALYAAIPDGGLAR